MCPASIRAFAALLCCFCRPSAAAGPPGHQDSPWFRGWINGGGGGIEPDRRVRNLDPVTCCAQCLRDGFPIAGLSPDSCYCGKELISPSGPQDVRGDAERQSNLDLPVGMGPWRLALYRTDGPFLHRVSLSTSPRRVHTGETFVLQVSGELAGGPDQPTGIPGLTGKDLSDITVEFPGSPGQSSRQVSVSDDGSFSVSSEWIAETPGTHEIRVRVSNPLSKLSSGLRLSVLKPFQNGSVITLLHGPLGVPSCTPSPKMDPRCGSEKAVYVGDPVTLRVDVADGLEFYWWFTAGKREEKGEAGVEERVVKMACPPNAHCLNSTVIWTFQTEGLHRASVNASNASGWTQETICIVVVRPVVSDLKVSVSRDQVIVGGSIAVDVDVFTTMKHLLLLRVQLSAGNGHKSEHHKKLGCKGARGNSSDFGHIGRNVADVNETSNDTREITDQDPNCNNSSYGSADNDHAANQHNSNIYCSQPDSVIPLSQFHSSDLSGCRLLLHLPCHLPIAAGQYHLVASIFSSTAPSLVLLSTVLPGALTVYERIRVLRPSGSWASVVAARSEFRLEVVGSMSGTGSKLIWTFRLNQAILMNRMTEEQNINVSLPIAGRYHITVKMFNPVSWASFHTHIEAEDPVRDLILKVPSVIQMNRRHFVFFSVSAGSNLSVSLAVNGACLYSSSSYVAEEEVTAVLLVDHTDTVVVELRAENQVSSRNKRVAVTVEGNQKLPPQMSKSSTRKPHDLADNVLWIYAASQAYPTNTDVTFLAVTDVPDPVEFLWYFGDSRSTRTTSRTVIKRYYSPGRYDVVVVISGGANPLTSEVFPLLVQRPVILNRLVHQAAILQNQTAVVSCRVNVGTDVNFLWSFGDGTKRPGRNVERHVFNSTGLFKVKVTASNLVSSTSLSSYIFVVEHPCQPPPVKNFGPLKLQVHRHEMIRLGVTYESDFDCDITRGLRYTWTLLDSGGRLFPLSLTDTHHQNLVIPNHLLHYDTYTATARVEILGSVVYSNYTVRVQVLPSLPVASIEGGTNIFINIRNNGTVTLDGRRSHNPDFPLSPISFNWNCEPVSSVKTGCFVHHVSASSASLHFPVCFLKRNFDQFRFALTIHSGERSSSSEIFVTLTSKGIGKVLVHCPQCQGEQVNWDQSFSVTAVCEDCGVSLKNIRYAWNLHLINASSKAVTEVPFCGTVDLSTPSTIMESPSTLPKSSQEIRPHTSAASHNTEEPFYRPPLEFEHLEAPRSTGRPPGLGNGDPLFSRRDISSASPLELESSADWGFASLALESPDTGDQQDYDFPLAEEGDPGISAGRHSGVDGETWGPGDGSVFVPSPHEDEGSNLVHSSPSVKSQAQTLLDLPRDPVDRSLFESYTYTGISSPLLSFRPFSLRPGSRYMLEVTAESQSTFLGRTQLFLKTNPAPKGMRCQVQPIKGLEFYTHYSIFCTSGREDLLYEYSFSVGDKPPRILYKGRDFQYYFSLPSGDHRDDHKVTIYTKIRSGMSDTSTKPCSVVVQVQPSFLRDVSSQDPDLQLAEAGLRNLTVLVQLGNSVEIRNFVSLLSEILNRLSQDRRANNRILTHVRSALICTVCQLESNEQAAMIDSILILKELSQITHQITQASIRRVMAHVQAVSERLFASTVPDGYHLDKETLENLITLLSYCLRAVIAGRDITLDISRGANATQELDSEQATGEKITKATPNGCLSNQTSVSTEQLAVADILQTTSDLMLRYIYSSDMRELRISTGGVSLYATYINQTTSVLSSRAATVFIPASISWLLFSVHERETACVVGLLTELAHSPYTRAGSPPGMGEPVVDLHLYRCSTRREIQVRSLIQPIIFQLELPRNHQELTPRFFLLCSQVNYHSFNITGQQIQRAIRLRVFFTPPPNKAFPIMLLFRMLEKPTPSMHHLQRVHNWESNSIIITLPPSYLRTAGVGYLALVNADFGSSLRHSHLSSHVNYSLTVDSSQCFTWDLHQGAWTYLGCRTQQVDGSAAVNCSCRYLRPLAVVHQELQCTIETAALDPFLSVSGDLTVFTVLALCLCLYIPGLLVCRRSDLVSEGNRRVHYLPDNCPRDPYLYAVTIHTSPCSAAKMSAKVYIALHGEDGLSQTRELQVPGCTLFRRNSQDIFILSAAENLGQVRGVHVWHDNSGPTPNWFLKLVEVSELSRGHAKKQLFVGQCWLSVNKGDGQVERKLQVCTRVIGFKKMLPLKLLDFLADFHIWISVCFCPCRSSFTHTQRLSVCLLLLLGYSFVSAVIVSRMDEPFPFDLGIIAVSPVSVTTGVLSVVAVLPAATVISLLFRLREVRLIGSGFQHVEEKESDDELGISDNSLNLSLRKLQPLESWSIKYQGTGQLSVSQEDLTIKHLHTEKGLDSISGNSRFHGILRDGDGSAAPQKALDNHANMEALTEDSRGLHTFNKPNGRWIQPAGQWSHHLAWTLCLVLSVFCLVVSIVLGWRFSSSKVLLWIHSLFFSLLFCIVLIQPILILAVAVTVSLWFRQSPGFHDVSGVSRIQNMTFKPDIHEEQSSCAFPQERSLHLEKQLRARQRARYLRLVRPSIPDKLKWTRRQLRKDAFIHKTLRDLTVCVSMLLLMLCVAVGSPFRDHYLLHKAIRQQIIGGVQDNRFLSIWTYEDWWKWAHGSLLNALYKNSSAKFDGIYRSHILIGEPVLWKTEKPSASQCQVSSVTLGQECQLLLSKSMASTYLPSNVSVTMETSPRTCGPLGCQSGWIATFSLGKTKFDATSRLMELQPNGLLRNGTEALMVRLTLYCPASSSLTAVTLFAEQSPVGALRPSAEVQSVWVSHTPTAWGYVVVVCQLIFLLLSLLNVFLQIRAAGQQGLTGYIRKPSNWLEVTQLTVTLVYYMNSICHSSGTVELVKRLQRQNYEDHVAISLLAKREQDIRSFHGILLFLLAMKCLSLLSFNRAVAVAATHFSSTLFCPMISSVTLLLALSSLQTLLQPGWNLGGILLSGHARPLCRVICLSFTVMAIAVVRNAASSMTRTAKRHRSRKKVFTFAELAAYMRRKFCQFTGHPRHARGDEERTTYYLEEFESLVDELLFRLGALSDSLHLTLPAKAHPCTEVGPLLSLSQELINVDSQVQLPVDKKHQPLYAYAHTPTLEGEATPGYPLLRDPVQQDQGKDVSCSDTRLLMVDSQHGGALNKGTEQQTDSKGLNLQPWLQSGEDDAPQIMIRDGCLSYKRGSCKTKDSRTRMSSCANTVVEVMIHEQPGNLENISTV